MKYFLSLLACLFITTYSYSAFPVHINNKAVEKHQTMVGKSIHNDIVKFQKLVPHPGASGHGMAVLSIILGIIGLFTLHLLFGILALLIGLASMRRHLFRRPLAIAGVVLGIIDIILAL